MGFSELSSFFFLIKKSWKPHGTWVLAWIRVSDGRSQEYAWADSVLPITCTKRLGGGSLSLRTIHVIQSIFTWKQQYDNLFFAQQYGNLKANGSTSTHTRTRYVVYIQYIWSQAAAQVFYYLYSITQRCQVWISKERKRKGKSSHTGIQVKVYARRRKWIDN